MLHNMLFLNNYTAVIVQIKGSKSLDHVREVFRNSFQLKYRENLCWLALPVYNLP